MPLTLSGNGTVSGVNTDIGMRIITPTSVSGGSLNTGGSVSFSAASSVSVNGCFTSTYDNYEIMLWCKSSGAGAFYWRGKTSGTDNTVSNYESQVFEITGSATSAIRLATSNQAQFAYAPANDYCFYKIQVINPAKTEATAWISNNTRSYATTGMSIGIFHTGFTATTAFDGFSIYTGSGITGNLRIYGYNNG